MKTDKSQRNDNNRIKYLFVVALCLLAIAIGIRQATAAYLSISDMKAVASTNENESLFNSNYLYGYKSAPSSIATNTVEVNDAGSEVSFNVSIYNYHKQDINLVSQSDITYEISFQVSGSQSGDYSAYKVTYNNKTESVGNDGKYKIDRVTLTGRKAAVNNYMITMPTEDIDYAQIKVIATVKTVSGGTGTNIYCLAAILAPSRHSQVALPTVSGSLIEKGDLTQYDAYNYEVTIGGNSSDIVLQWNNSIVEIDPFFAKEFEIKDNPGTARLTLPIGTRVVQFYRTGADKPSDEDDLGLSVSKAK